MPSSRAVLLLLSAALAALLPAQNARALEAKTSGAVVGTVTDATTGGPLPGATVLLEGTAFETVADEAGRFALDTVPIGTYRILVKLDGFAPARRTDIVVASGRDTEAAVALTTMPSLKESVEVSASAFVRPPDVANGAFVMDYEEIRRAPGALGDVSRMIQAMPGVAARDDQRNDIVARGGSPIENLTLVDGIEVPNINHFAAQGASGGPVTMLNAELISDAIFLAGGFPSAYGSRVSSVLDVTLREGNRRKHQAEFDLSMAGAGFVAEGPLSSRGSYIASARRSFVDLIAGPFGLTTIPHYSNYQVKIVFEPDRNSRLTLVSLGGKDDISFKTDEDSDEFLDVNDVGWRLTSGLTYQRFFGSRATFTLSGSYSTSDYSMEVWDPELDGQLVARNDSRDNVATGRAELTTRLGPLGVLRLGGVARHFGGRLILAQPLGMDNPFSTDPTRIHFYDTDVAPDEWETGGHIQLTSRLGRFADITLGTRADSYSTSGETLASPRGSLVVHPTRTLDLSASYGWFNQSVPQAFILGLPENGDLLPIGSTQGVVGLAWAPRPGLRMSLEAYDKKYEDYPVSTEFPYLSLAALGGYYGAGEALMPGTSRGTGRSRGIEFYLQKKLTSSLYGQISYAYSKTRHEALDGVSRPSAFDVPHVLSLVAGYRFDTRYELSTRYTYTSGRPETPLLEAESAAQNRTIFDSSRLLGIRGPYYGRLDLRADRRYNYKWGSLTTYLELDNVLNRENLGGTYWNPNKKQLETLEQLSFLAIGGVTVRF